MEPPRKRRRLSSASSTNSDDTNDCLNTSLLTCDNSVNDNDDLQILVAEHLDLPSSPLRGSDTHDFAESLQERIDHHINIGDPAGNLPDTPLKTDDGLEDRIAQHFQVLSSASKPSESFHSSNPFPSEVSATGSVDSNLKIHVTRVISFEGLLPPGTGTVLFPDDNSNVTATRENEESTSIVIADLGQKTKAANGEEDASSSNSDSDVECEGDEFNENQCEEDDEEQQGQEDNDTFDQSKRNMEKAIRWNDIKLHDYTEKTVNEGILDVMLLHINNRDSKLGLQRLLSTTCGLLPKEHLLPSSSYKILNYVKSLAPPIPISTHYYCQDCLLYQGNGESGECVVCTTNKIPNENSGTKFNKFYTFGIGETLKYLFECRDLAGAIDFRFKSKTVNPGIYSDIQDGSEYKEINANRNMYDITFILNADGVRIRDSSLKELWIVMFAIIEVPIELRESYIVFGAVWYDAPKPKMNTLLKPICEELVKLDKEGFSWTHPITGNIINSKVKLCVGVFDAPARAMSQNLLNFNGVYGCNTCETKTVKSTPIGKKKVIRVYPYKADPVLRTKENMVAQASDALERNVRDVKGVKGPSVLSLVPSVDISKFFIPEYMHSVLLGVMKHMLSIWTLRPGPWNIKHCLPEIDRFLGAVKHPDFVHRAPRVLMKMKFMKASDFYYFLLFEGLPSLQNRLPEKYFQHFILLSKGIYLLVQFEVTDEDVKEADKLLQLFVRQFASLYTDRLITSNVHCLVHLCLIVRRFGPLSCNNAFLFEHINGLISSSTHGTNHVITEIINNVKTAQGVIVLKNVVKGLLSAESWCLRHSGKAEVLGTPHHVHICPEEAALVGASALIYSRAQVGSESFTSLIHKELSSENFHIMFEEKGKFKYAAIKYFAKNGSKLYMCLKLYKVDHVKAFFHIETRTPISHLIPVESTDEFIVKEVTETNFLKVGKVGCFLCKRPNRLHGTVN